MYGRFGRGNLVVDKSTQRKVNTKGQTVADRGCESRLQEVGFKGVFKDLGG